MLEAAVVTTISSLALMLGPPEIIVIGLVALLLFGKRLPDVARSAGKAVVSFKKGLRDVEQDIESASEEDESDGGDDPTQSDTPKDQG